MLCTIVLLAVGLLRGNECTCSLIIYLILNEVQTLTAVKRKLRVGTDKRHVVGNGLGNDEMIHRVTVILSGVDVEGG